MLDKVFLDCDDLGDNEVTLMVSDASGNTSLATAIVTLKDPNNYCELGIALPHKKRLKVYPNPTQRILHIEAIDNPIDVIQVFDLNGRSLIQEKFGSKKNVKLNMEDFSKGVYFIKISSGKQVRIKKIIKK